MTRAAGSSRTSLRLAPAEVRFENSRPVSPRFGDVYYDVDGPSEVERVFLAPAAFAERTRRSDRIFTVAEFGFGTGLNFLVAASEARCRLHFLSFERHPLALADLARALAPWRRTLPLARDLERAWPPLMAGWHRRSFDAGRVTLTVYYGDIADGMAALAVQDPRRGVDAWLLDGFAPARNPDMWRPELLEAAATLCAPDATATTFSAAGDVRRSLAAAGFEVRRIEHPRGNGANKRHTTAGVYRGQGRVHRPPTTATVFGAGLAGAATARALAHRGIAVRLVDRGEGLAAGASGIPAALLHGRLLPGDSTLAAFRAHAYAFAANYARNRPGAKPSGCLQLPGGMDAARLRQIAADLPAALVQGVDAREAQELAGLPTAGGGLHFPGALTVDGPAFVARLARHPLIEVVAEAPAAGPQTFATGYELPDAFDFLEVAPLAGQMDRFKAPSPAMPVVADGVFVPASPGVWAGATYEHRPWSPAEATEANAERCRRAWGRVGAWQARFRGVRATTSDRLPVVGQSGGRWFNLGHGSAATTTALFSAEIVASALSGEVAPATSEMLALLEPDRFQARQRRRGDATAAGLPSR